MGRSAQDIRTLRERLKLTQEALARKLNVSYGTIVRWEAGRSRPSPMAEQLLDALENTTTTIAKGGNT